MNLVKQPMIDTSGISNPVPLTLTEEDVKSLAAAHEKVMEEIRLKATQMGPVLEGILHEAHGQPRWGLNE